jgi:hypothetical protein
VGAYLQAGVEKLYPGIHAVDYSSEGCLETNFIVQPRYRLDALRIIPGGKGTR